MITETTEPTGKQNGGPPMFCFVNIESDVAKAYPLLSPVRKRLLWPFLMTKIPSFSLSLSTKKLQFFSIPHIMRAFAWKLFYVLRISWILDT